MARYMVWQDQTRGMGFDRVLLPEGMPPPIVPGVGTQCRRLDVQQGTRDWLVVSVFIDYTGQVYGDLDMIVVTCVPA